MTSFLESLLTSASFVPTSLQRPNAWVGHLPFGSWAIKRISPRIFVELGTHSGNSYFTFCQSVVDAGIPSKCYAVDTWQGDEHSGLYGEEIFAKVNAYHQEHYAGFSRLLRTTFDNAVNHFGNESIELLHIDGLHTYGAVRHDFEYWLPKLAPGAVVIFHDTNVHDNNFGVWRLWEELQESYPFNLEFAHSHGLGVLQLNNVADDKKQVWLEPGSFEKRILIDYFTALGLKQLERFELSELKQDIVSLNQSAGERDRQIDYLNQALTERNGQISSLNRTHDGQITRLNQTHDRQIASLNQALAERDGQIVSLNRTNDRQVATLSQGLAERDEQIASLNGIVADRDRQIAQIRMSRSWRITLPLRDARRWTLAPMHQVKRYTREWRLTAPGRQLRRIARAGRAALGRAIGSRARLGLLIPPPLFDATFYRESQPDLRSANKLRLWIHYHRRGVRERRNPNPLFDTGWYLDANPDVQRMGINPLLHYWWRGAREGRDPHPLFSIGWYLEHNPDVAASGLNPLLHFLQCGGAEGRAPHPAFDAAAYLAENADVATGGMNPLVHYWLHGRHEGRGVRPADRNYSSEKAKEYTPAFR